MIILYDRDFNRLEYITKDILKLSYKKHLKKLWEATVVFKADDPINHKIKPYYFMELYDSTGEYIGVFRVSPQSINVSKDQSTITYKLYHALHTLYDTANLQKYENSGDVEDFINGIFQAQAKQYWKFGGVSGGGIYLYKHAVNPSNGLLEQFFQLVDLLGSDAYPVFDTQHFPWTVSIARVSSLRARLKEGYSMSTFGITKDPTAMYNRIYPVGEQDTYMNSVTGTIYSTEWRDAYKAKWDAYDKAYEEYKTKKKAMDDARATESARRKQLENERKQKIADLKAKGSKTKVPALKFGDLPPAGSTLKPPTKPNNENLSQTKIPLYIDGVNDGKKYIQDDKLVAEYGPIEYYQQFNTSDPEYLMTLGKDLFRKMMMLKTEVDCTLLDLKQLVEEPLSIDRVRLGEKIYFETEEFGQFEMYVISEGKDDVYGSPEDIEISLSLIPPNSSVSSSTIGSIVQEIGKQQEQIVDVRASADGKNTITTSELPPANPKIGDTWYFLTTDPETGLPMTRMRTWNGVQWVDLLDYIQDMMDVVDDKQSQLESLLGELDAERDRLDYESENSINDILSLQQELINTRNDINTTIENINNTIAQINQNAEILKNSIEENTGKLTTLANTTQQNTDKIVSIEQTTEGLSTSVGNVVRDQEGLATKISDYKTEVDAYNQKATEIYQDLDPTNIDPNSTGYKLTKVQQKANSIIEELAAYAKKEDLNGYATEAYVNTTVTTEAGKIQTSLSEQIVEVNNKVQTIEKRPVYTIGEDGYWYKDGVKTDTKAIGTDGKSFSIKGTIPDGGSLPSSGSQGDAYIKEGRLYIWDGSTWRDLGSIQGPPGKDGKDAYLYQGETAPTDTKTMWYNPKTGITSVYYNGAWRDVNSKINERLNNVVDTVDSHTRTISQVQTDLKTKASTSALSEVKQTADGLKTTVSSLNNKVDGVVTEQKNQTQQITTFKQTVDGVQTTVATLNKRLNDGGDLYTMITEAKQTADGFSTTIQEIQNDINSLPVGGRNLLKNSKINSPAGWAMYDAQNMNFGWINDFAEVDWVEGINAKKETNLMMYLNLSSPMFLGETVEDRSNVALSFDAKNFDTSNEVDFYIDGIYNTSGAQANERLAAGASKRIVIKGTYKGSSVLKIQVRNITLGTNVKVSIHNVKFEKGTEATPYKDGDETINIRLNTFKQTLDGTTSLLSNTSTGLMSLINQQAGRIIFDVTDTGASKSGRLMITQDGAIMENAFIQTGHIADASITNAKIQSLSASKITTGTLDANKIRVVNLDASAITTGIIRGANAWWNLGTAEFYNGVQDKTSIEIFSGKFVYRKKGTKQVTMDGNGAYFWGSFAKDLIDPISDSLMKPIGVIQSRWWKDPGWMELGVKNFSLSHMRDSTMTLSYLNVDENTDEPVNYSPYITFDYYKELNETSSKFENSPIVVHEKTLFRDTTVYKSAAAFMGGAAFASSVLLKTRIVTSNGISILPVRYNVYDESAYCKGRFIGVNGGYGLLIGVHGLWWIANSKGWGIGNPKPTRSARQEAAYKINNPSTGNHTSFGGMWQIIADYDGKGE